MNKITVKKNYNGSKKVKNKMLKTQRHKKRKNHKRTKRIQRGGFGPKKCAFAGKQWNNINGGNYYKLGTPIGIGGISPFIGNVSPLPQHPPQQGVISGLTPLNNIANNASSVQNGGSTIRPLTPQVLLDAYRVTLGSIENLVREYQGLSPLPSPQPWSQHQQQL